MFERPHSEQLQTAVIGSKYTVTTSHIRIIHRKFSSKPVNTFEQEPTNRDWSKRNGREICQNGKQSYRYSRKIPTEADLDTSPEPPTTNQAGTIGRGRPRLIRDRTASTSPDKNPAEQNSPNMGPLTIDIDQMSDSDIDQTIRDSLQSGQEIQIRDNSGKVTFYNNQRTEQRIN